MEICIGLAKIFGAKLIRFGQIWLNLGKIRRMDKIEAKFEQKRLDLGKIKILHPQKHSISNGYAVNCLLTLCFCYLRFCVVYFCNFVILKKLVLHYNHNVASFIMFNL